MKTTTLNNTKITAIILFLIVGLFSCKKDLGINFTTDLSSAKSIHIDQTTGTAVSFSESVIVELENEDTREYLDKIEAIEKINSFVYQFKNFSGDPAGIVSLNIAVNGTVIANEENVIVKDESDNRTVFEISDNEKLNQIAAALMNDQKVTFKFSGTALCDAAAMDFDMELKMNITVAASAL